MHWEDDAIVLSARAHGEHAAIVTVLAAEQGRCVGLVAGGQSRRWHAVLQPGNRVRAAWRARLPEHLGHFTLDLALTSAARWMDYPLILAAISSACAVTERALPERQPLPAVYAGLAALLETGDPDLFGAAYVQWELGLLAALGYGLDLSRCAVTQSHEDLAYVSPRTGRAVTREVGGVYHDKLLHLPGFLAGRPDWSMAEVWRGLQLTGHFLARQVFAHNAPRLTPAAYDCLPASRRRLAELYQAGVNVLPTWTAQVA
ncbi:MAG: DNA repair protein RecO [Alphaproteobacteria bacterium]